MRGVKTEIFKAGKTKDYGNPSRKVDAGERRELQAEVDKLHTVFLAAVARNRGMDVDELRKRAGDAQMFMGQEAIDVGLADSIGTLDETITQLGADPGSFLGERIDAERDDEQQPGRRRRERRERPGQHKQRSADDARRAAGGLPGTDAADRPMKRPRKQVASRRRLPVSRRTSPARSPWKRTICRRT